MVIEIVDFPIKNGGSFHSYVTVYQRVNRTYYLKSQVLGFTRTKSWFRKLDPFRKLFTAVELGSFFCRSGKPPIHHIKKKRYMSINKHKLWKNITKHCKNGAPQRYTLQIWWWNLKNSEKIRWFWGHMDGLHLCRMAASWIEGLENLKIWMGKKNPFFIGT